MSQPDHAFEQLRVIRSLMERATIYRSISAPTALVGGLLSLAGFGLVYGVTQEEQAAPSRQEFLLIWLVILALTGVANLVFLWRGSARRNEPFFSPGMRSALRSLAPALLAAGVLTLLLHRPIELVVVWLMFYGLALLATQHFAPRSLVVLGAAFFITACALLLTWKHFLVPTGHDLLMPIGQEEPSTVAISALMALTFGGYHLVYAAAIWMRGEDRDDVNSSVTPHV